MATHCKQCGAKMDKLSLFCPSCGAPSQAQGQPYQQPQQPYPPQAPYGQNWQQPVQPRYGQSYGSPGGHNRKVVRRAVRRSFGVSAAPQARLFGIPISGKAGIIILLIIVIAVVILNKTGVLS